MTDNFVISESDSVENFQYLSIEDIELDKKQSTKKQAGGANTLNTLNNINDPYYYKYVKYKIKYLELKHRILNR